MTKKKKKQNQQKPENSGMASQKELVSQPDSTTKEKGKQVLTTKKTPVLSVNAIPFISNFSTAKNKVSVSQLKKNTNQHVFKPSQSKTGSSKKIQSKSVIDLSKFTKNFRVAKLNEIMEILEKKNYLHKDYETKHSSITSHENSDEEQQDGEKSSSSQWDYTCELLEIFYKIDENSTKEHKEMVSKILPKIFLLEGHDFTMHLFNQLLQKNLIIPDFLLPNIFRKYQNSRLGKLNDIVKFFNKLEEFQFFEDENMSREQKNRCLAEYMEIFCKRYCHNAPLFKLIDNEETFDFEYHFGKNFDGIEEKTTQSYYFMFIKNESKLQVKCSFEKKIIELTESDLLKFTSNGKTKKQFTEIDWKKAPYYQILVKKFGGASHIHNKFKETGFKEVSRIYEKYKHLKLEYVQNIYIFGLILCCDYNTVLKMDLINPKDDWTKKMIFLAEYQNFKKYDYEIDFKKIKKNNPSRDILGLLIAYHQKQMQYHSFNWKESKLWTDFFENYKNLFQISSICEYYEKNIKELGEGKLRIFLNSQLIFLQDCKNKISINKKNSATYWKKDEIVGNTSLTLKKKEQNQIFVSDVKKSFTDLVMEQFNTKELLNINFESETIQWKILKLKFEIFFEDEEKQKELFYQIAKMKQNRLYFDKDAIMNDTIEINLHSYMVTKGGLSTYGGESYFMIELCLKFLEEDLDDYIKMNNCKSLSVKIITGYGKKNATKKMAIEIICGCKIEDLNVTKDLNQKKKNFGRYNIRFPISAWDDFPNELFSYKIFLGPVTTILSEFDTIDLCNNFKGLNYTSSCENYFCSNNGAFYDQQSKNMNLTNEERIKNSIFHIKMERYCTLCNQTFYQNFTENTCINKNQSYSLVCPKGNLCPSWSLCVPFHLLEFSTDRPYEPAKPVCYDFTDNTFYARIDFTHKFLYWTYYRYIPVLGLVGLIILFIMYMVFLIMPEISLLCTLIFCSHKMNYKATLKEKFFMIVTLRNLGLSILFFFIVFDIFAFTIDICGFFVFRFSTLTIYPSGGSIILCYFINVIIWQYILDQSRKSFQKVPSYSLKLKVQMVALLILTLSIIIIGGLLYVGQYFIDRQRRGVFIYVFGAYLFFDAIVFLLVMTAMVFYSSRIFFKITRSLEDRAVRIFKEKFTVFVMIMIPPLLTSCIALIMFSAQAIIGKDVFSIQLYMLQASYYILLFNVGSVG
eukprot:gene12179-5669_t